MIIQTENLTKIYGHGETAVTALHHLNLSVEAGEFVKRYQASHNGEYPNPTSFVGFAGAWILYKHIMPKAGGLDPDKLREAALGLDVPPGKGVLNWGIKFSPSGAPDAGQNVYASAGISQWQDGKLKLVFPKEIATAEAR